MRAKHPPCRRLLGLGVMLAIAVAGCDSAGPDDNGTRTVSLSPEAVNGSAVIHLTGGAIRNVTSTDGPVFFAARGDTTRVVLLRVTPGPIRFDVQLDDPSASLTGAAIQVGTAENTLRPDPSVYRVEVNP